MKSVLGSLAVVLLLVACGSPVVDFPVDQSVGSGVDGGSCDKCNELEDGGDGSTGGSFGDADASLPGCN